MKNLFKQFAVIIALCAYSFSANAQEQPAKGNVIVGKYVATEGNKIKIEGKDGNIYLLDKEHITGTLKLENTNSNVDINIKDANDASGLQNLTTGSMVVVNIGGIVVVDVKNNTMVSENNAVANNNRAVSTTSNDNTSVAKAKKSSPQSSKAFGKGISSITAAVGLGSVIGDLPITLSYETGIYEQGDQSIGLGAVVGYASETEPLGIADIKYVSSNILVGARCGWHYTGVDNLDLYAGVTLGYNVASGNWTDIPEEYQDPFYDDIFVEPSVGGIFYSFYAGAKYYFTPNLGINAELGYGVAIFNVGLSFKF